LIKKLDSILGKCVRLDRKAVKVVGLVHRLFYLTQDESSNLILLQDLGIANFPTYDDPVGPSRLFPHRQVLNDYEVALDMEQSMAVALETEQHDEALQIFETAINVHTHTHALSFFFSSSTPHFCDHSNENNADSRFTTNTGRALVLQALPGKALAAAGDHFGHFNPGETKGLLGSGETPPQSSFARTIQSPVWQAAGRAVGPAHH
jgi:hypothetical protein